MDEETEANLPLTSFYVMEKIYNPTMAWNHMLKKKEKKISIPITALSITGWVPFRDLHKLFKSYLHHLGERKTIPIPQGYLG